MSNFRAQIVEEWNSAYGVAYAILRSRESAHDAAQEATLRALRFEHVFDERRPVRPWFLKIARNVAINEFRKRGRICGLRDMADRESALERLMVLHLCDAALHEAAKLPSIYRSALELKWRGYRYREIAAALGVPIGTAQTRVHRAQLQLRSKCLG